jgi:hypothetical protein
MAAVPEAQFEQHIASKPATLALSDTVPPPADTPTQQAARVRVGALCNDGTHSTATGGACSSHGGVKCWKYSYLI